MVNKNLMAPESIVVIGASENESRPGGKALRNLLDGGFAGRIYALNAKPVQVEGAVYVSDLATLPPVDLAILAIPASACLEYVQVLAAKHTGAFIIYSAGFGEAGAAGKQMELELAETVNQAGACLIGPNCIGVINASYKGVFTSPVPEYHPQGCELISSSGATAVFIMEAAMSTGLRFSNVYSIGNAAQTGVEELLEYMDIQFDPLSSPRVKLLYLENIRNPQKFLRHAASLSRKGCRIAAIKSGYSEAGSRAASSHTGALATSDTVIRALFKKAGIVYCSGREELITVGCIFSSKERLGGNIAIITHAGGSAVMLTDVLSSGGLKVPFIEAERTADLLKSLHPGSSVSNPFDFLATGTAEQLGKIIDFCENQEQIDAMIVVFGSPGLFNVKDVYGVIDRKMAVCKKPIYPVLPSLVNAKEEINVFLSKGHVNFPDEVVLGIALTHIHAHAAPPAPDSPLSEDSIRTIREIVGQAGEGCLPAAQNRAILVAAGIGVPNEHVCISKREVESSLRSLSFPLALKVIGPVHKTESGGVTLNLHSKKMLLDAFHRTMQIPGATGVLIQEMVAGPELFVGAVKKGPFGHLVLCGLGGIFVELINDIAYGLAPLSREEALDMIRSLKGYALFRGFRSQKAIDESAFADAIVKIAALVRIAPEISELDINPVKYTGQGLVAVDARIRIEKQL